ncbi:MAG TPA: hypothetical protein EYN66_21215 [Myxococcales bacterium]|nr:hypothetical protein [Myxococcales bacterium]
MNVIEQQFEKVETSVADLWLDSDNTIQIRFKPTTKHGLEEAKEVVKIHNALTAGVARPVLADIRLVTVGANRDARNYYVSEEASRYKLCMAMLVNSPMQRMLGNLFMFLNRPPYPTRLFVRSNECTEWLKRFAK